MEHSNVFHEHPIIGFLTTIIAIVAAETPKLMGWDYPPFVMHSFQILAWLSAFGVFLISLKGYIKKNKKSKSD